MKNVGARAHGCLLRGALWLLASGVVPVAAFGAELTVDGGSGRSGETVQVVIRLAGDGAGAGVSVDLDIAFPSDLIGFDAPVDGSCRVAPRLEGTH